MTARLGGNVLYPWDTVTLAVYIPAHEATRQWTVRVSGWNNGPQVVKLVWLTDRIILTGLLTSDFRVTGLVTAGAHLNRTEALPVPALSENFMVIGFAVQTVLGAVSEAKPTAA